MDLSLNNEFLQQFFSPIFLSVKVATIASLAVIIIGTLIGRYFSIRKFKGQAFIETLLMLPMVLPPTVVGFLLIVIFGKNSFFGRLIENLFNKPVIFTWWAAVIASIIVAFPLMYQSAKSGFAAIDRNIEDAARVGGASEGRILIFISIPLAARALITGSILSFARAIGEFGATLMFAGNIPGKTQTIPTAIYVALDSGNMKLAWLWVISIVIISFIMLRAVRIN